MHFSLQNCNPTSLQKRKRQRMLKMQKTSSHCDLSLFIQKFGCFYTSFSRLITLLICHIYIIVIVTSQGNLVLRPTYLSGRANYNTLPSDYFCHLSWFYNFPWFWTEQIFFSWYRVFLFLIIFKGSLRDDNVCNL